jgi:hypothetical protein
MAGEDEPCLGGTAMRYTSCLRLAALCAVGGCFVLAGCLATSSPAPRRRTSYYTSVSLSRYEGARNRHFSTRIVYSSNFIKNPQYKLHSSTRLPPGTSLNTSTGIISGTPTQSGIWNVRLGVRDRNKGTHDQPPGKTYYYFKTFEIRIYDKYIQPRK